MDVDVVVVGSGAGGLTSAVVAANQGLKVLLLESTPYFGGTTAFSGGAAWIPLNHHMKEVGITDTRAEAETYLRGILGNFYDTAKVNAYLDQGPAMVEYLEKNTDVQMQGTNFPDYEAERDGSKPGRCIFSIDYDARELGPQRKNLRPPRRDTQLFGSMQLSMADPVMLKQAHKSLPAFLYAAKIFSKYFFQRLVYGRGMRVANGNALIARLMSSAMKAGVIMWNNAPAKELILTGGAVTGVVAVRDGKEHRITVRKGVVLAGGGFGHNKELRERFVPHATYGLNLQPEGSKGEGILMGVKAGGRINEGNAANGIWQPVSPYQNPDGSWDAEIYAMSRLSPGSIIVDAANGKRFVNEGTNYHSFVNTMHAKGVKRGWQISDHPAARKYGIGLAKPWPYPIGPWIGKGYVIHANTIAELAPKIGLDPKVLEATVAKWNQSAEQGVDPEFHKGEDAYSRYLGDAEHKPNPSVGPIKTGPFYAVPFIPGETSAAAGLDTNENAQVLGAGDTPIKGLYAAGLDNNTMMRGTYPGGGASIGPAMTFGYIAAKHMAAA